MSAKGYLFVQVNVTDPVAFEAYKTLAHAAITQYGGRYLVRGGETALLEGKGEVPRMTIVEFDSFEQVKLAYASPEYQAAKAVRANAADMRMIALAGLEN